MSTRRLDNRLDSVEQSAGRSGGLHVMRLLPEDSREDPDRPEVWADEDAMSHYIDGLPESHCVITIRYSDEASNDGAGDR